MSWRTVYISSQAHLSFKNNFLVIRSEDVKQIYIPEINTILIDSNMSSASMYLLNELVKAKVKVIVCDEKHNPSFELMPYYGAYNSTKMITKEADWQTDNCDLLWKIIVQNKIRQQAKMLEFAHSANAEKLYQYAEQVENGDITNREGHAAKVYFNSLFGKDFSRDDDCVTNAILNYGYAILLSKLNREIVNDGYITQIGIHHHGAKNPFNLSCDLMEPFRPIVDRYAFENESCFFGKNEKIDLIRVLDAQILYDGKKQYLTNAISQYVSRLLGFLEDGELDEEWLNYDIC